MIQKFSRLIPAAGKAQRTFWKRACPEADHPHFLAYAAKLASVLRHAIFVDHVVYSYEDREEILQLLKEHVTDNIVKVRV
ncbi:hypothetical protein K439DRAFT_269561 [Ramaria rubella]|nr:hypothetical protein K439DRAFT_269561 [Ramaria rubella]